MVRSFAMTSDIIKSSFEGMPASESDGEEGLKGPGRKDEGRRKIFEKAEAWELSLEGNIGWEIAGVAATPRR